MLVWNVPELSSFQSQTLMVFWIGPWSTVHSFPGGFHRAPFSDLSKIHYSSLRLFSDIMLQVIMLEEKQENKIKVCNWLFQIFFLSTQAPALRMVTFLFLFCLNQDHTVLTRKKNQILSHLKNTISTIASIKPRF